MAAGRAARRPVIVIVCGPPGAGKTTVATLLRDRLAARGLSVELLDSDEFSSNTYERMYERIAGAEDRNWIVAGTFYRRSHRERFADLDPVVVSLRAALETCLERNRRRPPAESIEERAVHIVYREFDEPDADVVVDVDAPPGEVADRVLAGLDRPTDGE